ncbi:MAG TPA: 50S ribosomal protein L23 [Kiritimatiellia bacterium]|jgi:large subunit ribosomal protein L23
MKQPYSVIKKLTLTEKGARLTEKDNKYLFRVHGDANKQDIKRSVEALFRVNVTKVNTLNRRGKIKRNRLGGLGTTNAWKRAIVTLKQGDKIEMGT